MKGRFSIEFRPTVEKDLRSIERHYHSKIFDRINRLSLAPVERGALKLDDAKKRYRIRVGIYRIIYRIDYKDHTVIIEAIRHRKEVYRSML